jgi:hypothetical protein
MAPLALSKWRNAICTVVSTHRDDAIIDCERNCACARRMRAEQRVDFHVKWLLI